jgi:hypothetical protein
MKRSKPRTKKRRFTEITCDDCSFKLVAGGEYYMVSPQMWVKKLGLGFGDNLCIKCLETRLGRKLKPRDFISFPQNPGGFPDSDRYDRRRLGDKLFAILKLNPGEGDLTALSRIAARRR